ncbi:MAG TPA: hypothetical protein VGF45_11210 [Polyangia bacterium]
MSLSNASHVSRLAFAVPLLLATACATPDRKEPPQQKQFLAAISPPARLEPPESLPGPALELLRSRMANHASDMGTLMSAIMILRYPEIEARANAIANETTFARPITQDATELNAALPENFFVYQRELRVLAASLANAASRMDALQVADAYGKVSETCVRCHASYRAGR